MKFKPLPSQIELRERFDYNPETGVFTHILAGSGRRVGDQAGCQTKTGYVTITVNQSMFKASRLAWMWMTGEDPQELTVDHINRNKSDNRFSNLRLATESNQAQNRNQPHTSKRQLRGVQKVGSGRYQAMIKFQSEFYYLGTYDTELEASKAYNAKALELHGEFATLNSF